MIRLGALALGLSTITFLIAPTSRIAYFVALGLVVLGVVLIAVGREPWPRCCAHCPVYADRRARAARGDRLEATAIRTASAEELEATSRPRRGPGRPARRPRLDPQELQPPRGDLAGDLADRDAAAARRADLEAFGTGTTRVGPTVAELEERADAERGVPLEARLAAGRRRRRADRE